MIYIVIPVHNRKATTLQCLEHLKQQTYHDYKIVIVDDGSTDGTAEAITAAYPATTILPGDGQLWWAGAMHQGITYALNQASEHDYILSLNDDVIMEPDYLQQLLTASQANHQAVVGSLCKDSQDHAKILDAGITLQWKPYRYGQVVYHSQQAYVQNVATVSGRGVLIPVPVIKQIGNFAKEKFPHYGADYEYGLRIKAAGIPLIIANAAVVYLNDALTGFRPDTKILSYTDSWKKLFAIKSPANLFVHLRLVWLYAPTGYLKCYNIVYLVAGNGFLFCRNTILYTLLKMHLIKNSSYGI